jgi:3-hydroxybutyryl-CoA dehydrogenase
MRFGTNWPIGPCALIDLIGVDVHVHASEALHAALGEERMAPRPGLLRLPAALAVNARSAATRRSRPAARLPDR